MKPNNKIMYILLVLSIIGLAVRGCHYQRIVSELGEEIQLQEATQQFNLERMELYADAIVSCTGELESKRVFATIADKEIPLYNRYVDRVQKVLYPEFKFNEE